MSILKGGWAVTIELPANFDTTGYCNVVRHVDVSTITIGFVTKNNPVAGGGSGQMYIDDIRLGQPTETAGE